MIIIFAVLIALALVAMFPHYVSEVGLGEVDQWALPAMGATAAVGLVAGIFALLIGTSHGRTQSPSQSYSDLASELSQIAGKSEVVISAINDGVIALDGQGTIQLINPAAQTMLGWTKTDALNLNYKSVVKIFDTKNQPVTEDNDPIAQAQVHSKAEKSDMYSLQTHSGKSFLAFISVSPLGQPGSGSIIVFRDITSEKSDERQRAEFISTASHEMRTPIASIEGYLGLALNPATATIDEKARNFITKAHSSAQHLGRLFQDLLDVSKADDHRLKNNPSVVDIVPFIETIVEGLAPKAKEKGLRILYKPMPGGTTDENRRLNPVYYVNVDNDHLREISDNLIENAIKYTPAGDVVVDVTGDNDKVVVSITDTGIGIPREDQAHLFQKFYRVDNSDTREIGGTGLGLYLCRRLAETMGGRIWVESEYKKGSTFFVELPRLAHDDAIRMIEQATAEAERQAAQEQSITPQVSPSPSSDTTPISASLPTVKQEPIAPAPAPLQPTPRATPTPQPLTPAINTPLTTIEANPSHYTRREGAGPIVPPRQ